MRQSVSFGVIKYFRSRERWLSHNMFTLNGTLIAHFQRLIFCYMNFTSIRGKSCMGTTILNSRPISTWITFGLCAKGAQNALHSLPVKMATSNKTQ